MSGVVTVFPHFCIISNYSNFDSEKSTEVRVQSEEERRLGSPFLFRLSLTELTFLKVLK